MNIDASQIVSGTINKHRLPPTDEGGGGMTEAEADDRYVNESGDTMTGDLVLAHDPDQPMEAATKQYVDAAVLEIEEGTRILDGDGPPADSLGQVGNYYADKLNGVLYGPKGTSSSVANAVLNEPFNNLSAWTTTGSPTFPAGRTGTAAKLPNFSATATYTIPAASESDTIIVGCAFQVAGLGSEATLLSFRSDAAATEHCRLRWNGAGQLVFYSGTSGKGSGGVITANQWNYVEVKIKLHDTTGTIEVKLNGTTVIGPLTNQDTKNGGTKTVFDSLRLAPEWYDATYDDLYLKTGAGATFAGDTAIGGGTIWPVTVRQIPTAAKAYIHTQAVAATTWTVNHNLGYFPNVAVVDSAGNECIGDVTYTNVNTVTLKFSAAFSGAAYLS